MAEKLVIKIDGNIKGYQSSLKDAGKGTKKFEDGLKTIAKGTAVAFAGLTGAIGLAVNEAKKIETITTQFEVLTGSAGEAAKMVRDLQEFSAKTPFQFEGIAKTSQQLLGFQIAAEDVPEKLQQIGDVAAAAGRPMEEIGLIFGQVSAAGKLTGERLLQFQERAIPIGPALAKTMGVAEESIKDLVSRGEVDFATFEKAFASMSEKGGSAFQGMEKQSETLAGKISTVKDNISIFAAGIGQEMLPVIKLLADQFLGFIQNLQSTGDAVTVFNAVLGGTLKISAFLKASFKNLGGIIGTTLAAALESAKAAISFKFAEAKEIAAGGVAEIGSILKENNEQLNKDLKDIDDAFSEQARERREREKEEEIAHAEEMRELKKEQKILEEEELSELEIEQREREKEKLIEHEEAMKKIQKERIANVNEAKRAVALEDARERAKENDIEMKDEVRHGKAIAKLNTFFRSKEYEGTQMLFSNLETLGQSGNKKLMEVAKQAATAKAIMNTAEGITKALTFGPILGPVLAATQAAAGAIQIGVIQGVKFKDGGRFKGGIPGVDSIPATVQHNEIIAPTESFDEVIGSVRAKREADKLTGDEGGLGGGSVNINVSYDSPEASQIITVSQVEDTALGISRDSFKEAS